MDNKNENALIYVVSCVLESMIELYSYEEMTIYNAIDHTIIQYDAEHNRDVLAFVEEDQLKNEICYRGIYDTPENARLAVMSFAEKSPDYESRMIYIIEEHRMNEFKSYALKKEFYIREHDGSVTCYTPKFMIERIGSFIFSAERKTKV